MSSRRVRREIPFSIFDFRFSIWNAPNLGVLDVFNQKSKVKNRKSKINMAVPENVKKMWIEIQRKYDFPVNAIGVRINQKDSATLKVWKDEGIDQFQKK